MTEIYRVTVDSQLLDGLTFIVSRAGAAILELSPADMRLRKKHDLSPITAADEVSEGVIHEGISRLLPGIPIISEETAGTAAAGTPGPRFVVVDPLDGTKELLAGRDEFTVNIALMDHGQPIAGVICAPARGLLWRGVVGAGAERLVLAAGAQPSAARECIAIRTRTRPASGVVALVSRSHLDPTTESYLARLKPAQQIGCGSSLKFCCLAEGSADIYPRLAPTSEWDVAAGHAVLVAAGGTVTTPQGTPLVYGQPDSRIAAFIARGDRSIAIES